MRNKFNEIVWIVVLFSIVILSYTAVYSNFTYREPMQLAPVSVNIPSYFISETPKDEFELVEHLTGVKQSMLKGHMMTESGGYQYAIGDGGKSLGRFQINEDYRAERERMCGYEYDPFDKFDSAYVAGLIMQKNLKAFDTIELQVAAYRQGIVGVKNNGSVGWYAERVIKNMGDFT